VNWCDVIDTVQTDFAARLQSLDFFRDIYIAAPRLWKEGEKITTPKSILERVDQALTGLLPTNGKIGAAVRVFQPTINVDDPNGRKAKLMLVARCEVHPIMNNAASGTNKRVSRIGYEVLRAGLGFSLYTGFCSLYADGQSFLPYVSDDRKFETVDILLQANFTISPLDACKLPALTQGDNGLVTLTNVTPGADIWYSLDPAIFPSPFVTEAKKYDAPFTVDAGTNVRWAAYLDGLAGSHVGFSTINY
jgi:hypothetical protein